MEAILVSKRKMLIVHPKPSRGGFTAVVSQVKELLELEDYNVSVLVEGGDRINELPVECEILKLRYSLKSMRGVLQLRDTVRKVQPDILHLHGRQAGLIGRLTIRSSSIESVLYTPHGTPWAGESTSRELFTELSERMLLRRTTSVMCVSRSEQSDWIRRDQSGRIIYFPNVLDTHEAAPEREISGEVFLIPSGYHPQKRLEVVLHAISMLPNPRPEVIFCGSIDDPRYFSYLKRLAESLNVSQSVQFEQNLAGIRRLMATADKVILPSYSEGMPIVGLEAIVAGANTLWSAIPPHMELFGETGGAFWTAEELCALMMKPSSEFSVLKRRQWIIDQQDVTKRIRLAFWRNLAAHD